MSNTMLTAHGTLRNYLTGEIIRPATEAELECSRRAAQRDGGAGVIEVDVLDGEHLEPVSCYAEES